MKQTKQKDPYAVALGRLGGLKKAASEFARRAGSVRSARKAAASRANGKKGGRPKKRVDTR